MSVEYRITEDHSLVNRHQWTVYVVQTDGKMLNTLALTWAWRELVKVERTSTLAFCPETRRQARFTNFLSEEHALAGIDLIDDFLENGRLN